MSQKPDQWLASKFRGTDVLGADDAKIGDVSDILFDKTGKIDAFVISVGGFLGVGSKSVAMAPASFDVVPGKDGGADQLKLSMNKEQLTPGAGLRAVSAAAHNHRCQHRRVPAADEQRAGHRPLSRPVSNQRTTRPGCGNPPGREHVRPHLAFLMQRGER